jgi:tetratricopeptide (TPR) repeat protein
VKRTLRLASAALIVAFSLTLLSPAASAGKQETAIKLYKEGVKLGNAGKLDEAIAKWRASAKAYPKMYIAWVKMGVAYQMQRRIPQAHACFDLAIKAKKDAPDAWNGRGEFYMKLRLLDLAVDDFKQAMKHTKKVKKKRQRLDAFQNATKILLQQEKYIDVIDILKAGEKIKKGDPEMTFYAGYLAMKQDRDGDAEKTFQGLKTAAPDFSKAHYGLGLLYKKVGDREKAKAAFTRGCELKHKPSCKEKSSMGTRTL